MVGADHAALGDVADRNKEIILLVRRTSVTSKSVTVITWPINSHISWLPTAQINLL